MLVLALTAAAVAAMVFHFMYHLVDIFKAYFGEKFDEVRIAAATTAAAPWCTCCAERAAPPPWCGQDAIRNNFTLVYELLDGA